MTRQPFSRENLRKALPPEIATQLSSYNPVVIPPPTTFSWLLCWVFPFLEEQEKLWDQNAQACCAELSEILQAYAEPILIEQNPLTPLDQDEEKEAAKTRTPQTMIINATSNEIVTWIQSLPQLANSEPNFIDFICDMNIEKLKQIISDILRQHSQEQSISYEDLLNLFSTLTSDHEEKISHYAGKREHLHLVKLALQAQDSAPLPVITHSSLAPNSPSGTRYQKLVNAFQPLTSNNKNQLLNQLNNELINTVERDLTILQDSHPERILFDQLYEAYRETFSSTPPLMLLHMARQRAGSSPTSEEKKSRTPSPQSK